MLKLRNLVLSLSFFSVFVVSQLNLPQLTLKNYYLSITDPISYFDIGSYQLLLTTSGYTITSATTGVLNAYTNPTCVGTNNSQFFCVDESDDQMLNQLNVTNGQEYNFYNFSSDIVELSASFDSLMVGFNNKNSNFLVFQPPSTNPVCNMTLKGTTSYGGAIYGNGMIVLTPSTLCHSGSCTFFTYFCNNQTNVSTVFSYNKTIMNNFTIQPMIFASEGQSAIVGFPVGLNGTANMGVGYFLFQNASYVQNSPIGTYFQVVQINQTNILVLEFSLQLVQYTYNFTSGSFIQVGSSLNIPYVVRIVMSLISGPNQIALCISGVQGISNFYVEVSTMTVTSWDSLSTIQPLTFQNGSSFSYFLNGYFVGNQNFYINFLPFTGSIYFLRYLVPFGYPDTAYALYTNASSTYLYSLSLNSQGQQPILTNLAQKISSTTKFLALGFLNNKKIVATLQNASFVFYLEGIGQIFNISAPDNNTLLQNNMIFMDNQTNITIIYSDSMLLNISMNPWQYISNSSLENQFSSFTKMTETLFLGWYIDDNTGNLNISVFNAFQMSIIQTFIVPSSQDLDVSFSQVYYRINSTGNLDALFISTFQEDGSSVSYVLYPDLTNYTLYGVDMVVPGPGDDLVFCNEQLGRVMVNCSIYDFSGMNSQDSGGSGALIIICLLILTILLGGFLIRRNFILKRNQSKISQDGSQLSAHTLTTTIMESKHV